MDENIIQHNHDDDDETLEVRPLPKEFVDDKGAVLVPMLPDRSSNGHNGHEESRQPVALSASRARGRRISAPAVDISASASRRARVNRILMYRRRHKRYGHVDQTGPRMVAAISIILAVLFTLLSGTMGAAFAYYQSQLPLLNGIADHTQFQTTHIYDRHGQLLYNLYDPRYGRRTYVSYSDISPLLINATVAAEDHTFWTNSGVDIQGILRAAATNFQNQTVVEGGSTITQQLIKNELFLNQPRTVQIKAEEALLAYGLTQQYPKWKIMEMYLNTVYYGDLNYGIEAAAQDFFNLQPKCTKSHCIPAAAQLDLAQASMLAGLPQLPSYYNPIINKQAALDRQKIVLDFMVELHMITPAQEQQAQQEMAKFKFQSFSSKQGMQAPHFVRYVIDEVLVPLFGADNLFTGGYNIYTTLDLNLEKKVEQITYDHLYKVTCDNYLGCYGPLDTQNQVHNAAVVVENPFNGEILAMNGSANFNDNSPQVRGKFNSAADALRQPGSSIKPVIYATAFEMGWYPAMIIPDHKTIYPTPTGPNQYYTPQNYDGKFHTGFPMTVRNAIANSFNIPAIDALEFAGIPNVLNMAARLGLTEIASRNPNTLGPSLALGTAEVSLLHLTGAYATFANRGIRVPQTTVLEITDSQGNVVYKYDEAHPYGVRAVREDVAFLMSSILSDKKSRYHEFGPGNPLELDRPAAAKTGTTDSFRDNWTMGYTPYLTVGVWAGNSDNSIMQNVIGITGAGPIWHDVMEYASQYYNFPPSDFIRPADVHLGTVSAYTGLLPHPGEPTITDWFIDGTMPTIQGNYTFQPPKCDGGNDCNPPCNGDKCNPTPPGGPPQPGG
ncbi:MAG TPA: transglycosylase domain-containing protein [Ktedonobacteraceae bacterium]|nr:transglycosylase domain-containing protein [Ktedonobacteraceae bacterium]